MPETRAQATGSKHMKAAAALPMILSAAALGGVLVLFAAGPEAAPPRREAEPATPIGVASITSRIDELEREIDELEREVARLRKAAVVTVPAAQPERTPLEEARATPEPTADDNARDTKPKPKKDAGADRRKRREEALERRRTEQLQRLVDDDKITSMTDDQRRKLDKTLEGAREKFAEAFGVLRVDPKIKEMSREERREAMQAEMKRVREEVVLEMEAYLPAEDAKIIAETMLRRGNNRRGRGNRRRRND